MVIDFLSMTRLGDHVQLVTTLRERVGVEVQFNTQGNANQIVFPKNMFYKGRLIVFTEVGMVHPTSKGERMIHVFDVSDGDNDYRLEFDAERLVWLLTAILYGE